VRVYEPQVGKPSVKVRVERIRRGRRLPDIEYVETRSPRRSHAEKEEQHGSRSGKHGGQNDHGFSSGLRLPWRINHRSE
jgi:hypothetical protein